VPITQNVEVIKNVPVEKTKQIVENVQVRQNIPVTQNVEITKTVPTTKYVDVVENLPATTKVTTTQETIIGNNINTNINSNIITNSSNSSASFIRGIPGCKHCGGEGQFKSKSGKRMVPCKECVKQTGHCLVCKGDGKRPDKLSKRCECMYGKKK